MSPLEAAIEDLNTIDRELGRASHARDAISQALGYKPRSGSAARKIAALVQYGLVEREKDEYSISELADAVLHPTEAHERTVALRKAFFNVGLFSEVVEKYRNGGRLPGQLANLLFRQHRITAAVKDEVAEILLSSARFAGIVDSGGTFLDDESEAFVEENGSDGVSEGVDDKIEEPRPLRRQEGSFDHARVPQDLRQGAQVQRVTLSHGWAELSLPARLTARDLRKLRKLIEVVALDVEEDA